VTKAVNALDAAERDQLAAALSALEHLGEGLKS
jgi:hypothetical protein